MASSNKTDKLQLPQWELNDKPEMEDFNDAFNKVEDFKDEFDSHKAEYANNIKTISSSRATNLIGNQVFELGFKPRFLQIYAVLENTKGYESNGSFANGNYAVLHSFALTGKHTVFPSFIVRLHSSDAVNAATCTLTETGFELVWQGSNLPVDTIMMKIDVL